MSQPLASSSMSNPYPTIAPSSNHQVIIESALKEYQKTTKQDLTAHPLATRLQACETLPAILIILQDQIDGSNQSRSSDERMSNWLDPTISVLHAFSTTLGEGVCSVNGFTPANAIYAGIGILLLAAAKDVEASQGGLIDLFECIKHFFQRLEPYTNVPPTVAMTDMMMHIMVEVLGILGTATKQMQQGKAKKFLKKVVGIRKLDDSVNKLDKVTQDAARMATVQVLRITHSINETVQKTIELEYEKETTIEAKTIVRQTVYGVDEVKRRQLRGDLRKWQSPADPSTNHNNACDTQHEGTTEWFFGGSVFKQWKVTGSLLWIHGKPGSGKSVLCSAIIEDISTLCSRGSASMAYFYFDLRDLDKRSRRNLLQSLLVQLSARSDPFCDVLSRLYQTYDNGARQPSDSALVECLTEMLTLSDRAPVYLVLDALDESPNTSGVPSSREQVLNLVKELVYLHLPSLHICVTSRQEVDIQDALKGLVSHSVSIHDQSGQRKDISDYIRSVVYSDSTMMRRWRKEDKEHVIETLSERADGMFRWVFCQLETLQYCLPQNVRRVLRELPARLPESLDETYERVLKEIGRADRQHAYRLLQCLTVAIRPLRIEELAEILAFDFDGAKKGTPELKKGWRWKSQQEAVLSTCSSLISAVNDGDHTVVQFSHFSIKEFLTSDRLATSSVDVSHFHILLEPAHTIIAKVCLAILLRSDNGVHEAQSDSPLAKYAAAHWVNHAQFREVSTHLQDSMQSLFNLGMPYFESWLNSYDIDRGWDGFTVHDKQRGSPLYYASLCGFHDLVAHLATEHPQHVNATFGRCHTPLAAALHQRHFGVVELLYQRGADVGIRGYKNRTLLHAASVGGFIDISRWLLDQCVDARSQQDHHETPLHPERADGSLGHCINVDALDDTNHTPLHLASIHGHFETVRLLINHGAQVTSQDREHRTPLHLASSSGSPETVQVLIEHGADVNARDAGHNTPLHLASSLGRPETVRVLVKSGADVASQDRWYRTPLHLASSSGSPETVRVLIKLGADVNAMGRSHNTPLHLASSSRSPETMRLLVENGAKVTSLDRWHWTPLHLASSSGSPEIVQVLIENGADFNARDENHKTPLHLASSSGSPETARLLTEHGADVNARDGSHNTPLHLASFSWSPETVRVLIDHGASVNAKDGNHKMPLHLASSSRNPETVQILIEHGADCNSGDGNHNTPLHLASSSPRPETVQLLISQGANVNARDGSHNTPLHLALSSWRPETVRLLLQYGADVNARDGSLKTPLHLASSQDQTFLKLTEIQRANSDEKADIVQVLIQHGADVTAQDDTGSTPLHLASSKGSAKTVKLLLRHGADVNAQDEKHSTPLHLAARLALKGDVVHQLLSHGANVFAKDDEGRTPIKLEDLPRSLS